RRGGKSSGFSLSIAIILLYYMMINNGEHFAEVGKIRPWVGMWAPNLILLALGIYLPGRANRDLGGRRSDVEIVRRILKLFVSRRRQQSGIAAGALEADPALLTRPHITFPNVLDRYI